MNMQSLAKAQATMRDLKERLEKRVSGSASIDTVEASQDSSGNPMLFCSDGGVKTAGNPVIALRIKSQDAVSKDVFGNALTAFGPHTMEVAYELDGTEGEPSRRDLSKVMFEVAKLGFKTEVKEIADATAVSATSMDAASPADSLEYDTQWPAKGI
jgi:hypothetical protein